MKFGRDKGFVRNEASGEGGDERWIKGFKDGETEVRFLEQMDDWTPYWEHFDNSLGAKGAFFPCTGDRDTCPGCTSENERTRNASKRYLVNAQAKNTKDDKGPYVDLYKVGQKLAEDIEQKSSRDDGDLFKRMYYVIRSGSGLNTVYRADRDDHREIIDPQDFIEQFQDHEAALQAMWRRAFGELDPAEDKPAPRESRRTREVPEAPPEVEVPTQRTATYDEDPPSEPQPAQDQVAEADDEVTLSEEELRAMPADEIKALIKQCGFQVIEEDDPNALADYLIRMLGA